MKYKSLISLKNVSVIYTEFSLTGKSEKSRILDKLNLHVYKGETLGVIGKNGCGKSTLLKILTGIQKPDEGKMICQDLKISLQTLSAGFDIELSGRDNAILLSMFLGLSQSASTKRLKKIKEFSGLEDYFEKPVKTYSSGMRARLGFSVATQVNTDVLLIDEVLGVGDEIFRKKAEATIIEKIKSDLTVVFVSHSLSQIRRLCDRVVWLEQGKIFYQGDTSEGIKLYSQYLNQNQD